MAPCFHNFREENAVILFVCSVIAVYYIIMDIILYQTLHNTSLVKEAAIDDPSVFSPFHPLTIRLLVLDQTNHYIIRPSTEVFNYMTNFSIMFSFISPNIISATHAVVSIVVGKMVSSDNLRHRRMGAFLFELRTWLVSFAGVVYRSQADRPIFSSFHGLYGTTLNSVCDMVGGVVLCVGVAVYVVRHYGSRRTNDVSIGNGLYVQAPRNCVIVFNIFLYVLLVVLSHGFLAYFIMHLERFLEKPFPDPQLTTVQTTLLHSSATWLFLWMWRFFTQQMFQYLVIAIAMDKIWDYVSTALYFFYPTVIILMSVCYVYIVHMNSIILGGEFTS
ncbi:ceramide phosphoethanolamine synthase-like [Haliotis cracherodii]|uniref:ceramide phosphoethanolamine synthase-like n=1 Tax=Haliotis cracherodii TaxID=6455 RepID=UPI0039EB9BF7